MRWPWSRTGSSPIGVDFGAESLKLLQVIPGEPVELVAAQSVELPWEEGARGGRLGVAGPILKELVRTGGFRGRRAIVSLPASQVLVQHVPVHGGTEAEGIKEQIAQHLRERLNVEPERMVIRWVEVGEPGETSDRREEVICVAAERETVLRYIELMRRAGLDVVGMTAQPMAILRAFGHLFRRAEDKRRTTCFVDIGAETTKVVIAHGGRMVFARTIRVGGRDLFGEGKGQGRTKEGVGWLEGELEGGKSEGVSRRSPGQGEVEAGLGVFGGEKRARLAGGLSIGEGASDSLSGLRGRNERESESVARTSEGGQEKRGGLNREAMDCLVDELGLCVRFHQGQYRERAIEKLVFLGGVAQEVGVCRTIAQGLGIAAQLGDPLARLVRSGKGALELDLRKPQPAWAVAMGLCLTEPDI